MNQPRSDADRMRRRGLYDAASGGGGPRSLPWTSPEGKPGYLSADGQGYLSTLADSIEAVCVTGEERNCGATSGTLHTPDDLTRWIAEHCAQSGHELYEQTVRALVRAEPGAWQ
ncbi:hypothetical protein ACIO13_16635 [Streptomyces sp. NPDC087425]|uniref:DUF7848 domain-containing protein n=1 Tax=unclassified Streptomyces TaxID=2593676 RepID=UPI0037F42513